jgi:hypothetical protein
MTSNEITKSALIELKYRGFEAWRNNNLAVRGRTFIGKNGHEAGKFLMCEIKGKGDKLSKDQIELLTTAKKSGCIVFIATVNEGRFIMKEYIPYDPA